MLSAEGPQIGLSMELISFFITCPIALIRHHLALHIEFSDSPVDGLRQEWHRVRDKLCTYRRDDRRRSTPPSQVRALSSDWIRIMLFTKFTPAVLLLLIALAAVITVRPAQAQTRTETVLYSFTGGADGYTPTAGVIRDSAGNLYGTTEQGGATGYGTVFKVDNTGVETVLYSFCSIRIGSVCTDGAFPISGLVEDAAGNLYGTTLAGGNSNPSCLNGTCGTLFKIDSTGQETVLYAFCSVANCTDGYSPQAGLIQDAAGNLYGTTYLGGNSNPSCFNGSCGTLFKLDNTGRETVLYAFCSVANCADGYAPEAALMQDAAGNLYGSTFLGGNANANCSGGSCGTLFKVDSTGRETLLYAFCSAANCSDGASPYLSALIMDAAGNLYGTTTSGGNSGKLFPSGSGTVFKLDTAGHETVLYAFCAVRGCTDGVGPSSSLIQDGRGNLYGATCCGGSSNYAYLYGVGTIFKLDSVGKESVIYKFCAHFNINNPCPDGASPAGLIADAGGNLYGTTCCGGGKDAGVVFKLAGTIRVSLTSSLNPSYVGQSVALKAVVSGSGVTPTGSVAFKAGTTVLGTVALDNGQATLTTTFSKREDVSIVASYSGDQNYQATNSKQLKQAVQQYTTSTALASSLNPSTHGQAVTFTATVSSAGPTPTGFVTFKNGSTNLGKAPLSGNVATITTSTLPVGTLPITARYDGDAAHASSTSPVLQQVVN